MATPAQSVTLDDLLDAVNATLLAHTGLDPSRVVEYHGTERPQFQGDQVVLFRLGEWNPQQYSGAGRKGSLAEVTLQVRVWTKFSADTAGTTRGWFRNATRGHWRRMLQVLDAFSDQMLYSDVSASTLKPLPGASVLTIRPMQQLPTPFGEMSQKPDPSYGLSVLAFAVPLVKPLTLGIPGPNN